MKACYVCYNPAGTGTITVNDRTLPLCDGCSRWGYLRWAEEAPHRDRRWRQARLQGAINAAIWGGWSKRPFTDAEGSC